MQKLSLITVLIMSLVSLSLFIGCEANASLPPLKEKSIYEFSMKSIDGADVKMEEYKGKVLLIVNVASQCGYTPQYEGLQKLYTQYKDQGFYVLGFPANDFGAQEPGSDAEIKTFCSTKFNVTFPMFSKLTVVGADKHPFYRFLTEKATNPDSAKEVAWNFNKFLVDKNGKVVASYDSGITPDNPSLVGAIETALK
ncbi:MAG: glutathione peroxidase [Acidobacteria bacterium]|nr:glutathione peroxidase [Acidobacteriota bacterium]